jgi:protein-S-isoprenylcysteine O-methyltransferase Ste14
LVDFDWSIITQNADLIILNVVLFFLFAIIGSLSFKKNRAVGASVTVVIAESFGFSQRLAGVASFIIAFFIQMQGLAFTAYSMLWLFGQTPGGYTPFDNLLAIPGIAMFAAGGALVVFGWQRIFNAQDKALVTDGLYRYVRHPQYLGLLIATLGLIVYKFSPISLLLWPILVFIYYRLAVKEEKFAIDKFGEQYTAYKRKVHMFLPFGFRNKHEKPKAIKI